jgi:hypothetical protein
MNVATKKKNDGKQFEESIRYLVSEVCLAENWYLRPAKHGHYYEEEDKIVKPDYEIIIDEYSIVLDAKDYQGDKSWITIEDIRQCTSQMAASNSIGSILIISECTQISPYLEEAASKLGVHVLRYSNFNKSQKGHKNQMGDDDMFGEGITDTINAIIANPRQTTLKPEEDFDYQLNRITKLNQYIKFLQTILFEHKGDPQITDYINISLNSSKSKLKTATKLLSTIEI